MESKSKMTHASVFSGIGGPEVAASMLGWKNLFHCEINDFGRKVLEYHYPKSKSYVDITKTDFSRWRGKVDVLTGGFPCQPFSTAGKRRGAEDDRYLWPHMLRVIKEIRPTWFVAENVGGIRTSVLTGTRTTMETGADLFGTEDIRTECLHERYIFFEILNEIESAGYSVQPILIPACGVGAPHRRDRIFFVARRNDVTYPNDQQCAGVLRTTGEQRTLREESENRQDVSGSRHRMELYTDAERTCKPGTTTDTDLQRQHQSNATTIPSETERFNSEADITSRSYSDTIRLRSEQTSVAVSIPAEASSECVTNDQQSDAANTDCFGRRKETHEYDGKSKEAQQKERRKKQSRRADRAYDGQRWRDFPTVSPIYRGNDGIPFSLDNLTIPIGQWSRESLKAYGNAIVPQVMYEIFAAIDAVERSKYANKSRE